MKREKRVGRVMIIDDDPKQLLQFTKECEARGMKVVSVLNYSRDDAPSSEIKQQFTTSFCDVDRSARTADGTVPLDALSMLIADHVPDVILTDFHMGSIDGDGVLRKVNTARIPVVVHSSVFDAPKAEDDLVFAAERQAHVWERVRAVGGDAVIAKNCDDPNYAHTRTAHIEAALMRAGVDHTRESQTGMQYLGKLAPRAETMLGAK